MGGLRFIQFDAAPYYLKSKGKVTIYLIDIVDM